MCLIAEALFLFLNLLPPNIVHMSENRIVVDAETRAAIWELRNELWCTSAREIDAALRLKQGEAL